MRIQMKNKRWINLNLNHQPVCEMGIHSSITYRSQIHCNLLLIIWLQLCVHDRVFVFYTSVSGSVAVPACPTPQQLLPLPVYPLDFCYYELFVPDVFFNLFGL